MLLLLSSFCRLHALDILITLYTPHDPNSADTVYSPANFAAGSFIAAMHPSPDVIISNHPASLNSAHIVMNTSSEPFHPGDPFTRCNINRNSPVIPAAIVTSVNDGIGTWMPSISFVGEYICSPAIHWMEFRIVSFSGDVASSVSASTTAPLRSAFVIMSSAISAIATCLRLIFLDPSA